MKRNVVEMVLGAVVLLVAIGFLSFSYQAADVAPVNGLRVTANFSDIGSLKTGDDIRISGVKVGTIADISLDGNYLAQITMGLDSNLQLPDDTAAIVSSSGLLGGNYLALEPGASEDYLNDGSHIQYTQDAQNLERLLGQFIFSVQKDDQDASAQNL